MSLAKQIWLGFWVTISSAVGLTAGEMPLISVPVSEQAPVLDGVLHETEWAEAFKIEHLYQRNSVEPAPETKIYLTRDAAWLYLGAECANPYMGHADQRYYRHDEAVSGDDSLEIFLRPAPEQDYYHFLVNFAGVRAEQRCDDQGQRDRSWGAPWRAATARHANGWIAEIALPLYALNAADLSGLKLNIGRNQAVIDLDAYGAKQNERIVWSMLKPANQSGFHNLANFVPVAGFAALEPEIPFAPQIRQVRLLGARQADNQSVYDLQADLELATAVPGKVLLMVTEDHGAGEEAVSEQIVNLTGAEELVLTVPAAELSERAIKVILSDPDTGSCFAFAAVQDISALNVLSKVVVGRSYYTVEDNAEIYLKLGLPPSILKGAVIRLESDGKTLAEERDLAAELVLKIPVSELNLGENPACLKVILKGKELAARAVNLTRLEPRPGYETKMDFMKGIFLKDQEALFPIGVYGHTLQRRLGERESTEDDEALFKFLAEDIGLNTIIRGKEAKNLVAFMGLAQKYDLNVITWTVSNPPRSIEVQPGQPPLSPPDRLAFQKKWYANLEPGLIEDAKALRDYKNFISYYNVDEPNLGNSDESIAVAEWYYKTVQSVDPYRPQLLLYARHIPRGDNWTRWGEALGYDVYPWPYMTGILSEPGLSTAYYAYQLRERCRQDNKVMFFVPLSNMLDPARSPIGLNKDHMLCQAYVSVIYGARGLLYFSLSNITSPGGWDALRTISAHFKAMSPAILNGDITQEIQYTNDDFRPIEQKFPLVNAALFQDPDGSYLLLAANISSHAVETEFKLPGLLSARSLFNQDGKPNLKKFLSDPGKLTVAGNAFSDKFEPYGVRAYQLRLDQVPATLRLAVASTPVPELQATRVDIPGIVRQLMLSKNYMPNPCFEQAATTGCPDFYRPYFCMSVDPYWGQPGKSDWYLDDTVLWNGHPSLRMLRRNYELGGYKTRGMFFVSYPPISDQAKTMTFSFHARAEKPAAGLWFRVHGRILSSEVNIKEIAIRGIAADWQRYHFSFDLPAGERPNLGALSFLMVPTDGTTIWFNGLQLEAGEEPTDFQDDSLLKKK